MLSLSRKYAPNNDLNWNFQYDKFPTEDGVIKHLSYRASTKITEITDLRVKAEFDDVQQSEKYKTYEGKIDILDEFREYKSCPGNGKRCGKKVSETDKICVHNGCFKKLTPEVLIDDFRVTLYLQTDEDDFYPIVAFAKDLGDFMDKDATGIEKLEPIKKGRVKARVNPGSAEGMSDILVHLEFIDEKL